MEEGVQFGVLVVERAVDGLRSDNGRQWEVAGGQTFRQTNEIGTNAGLLAGKESPGAAKSYGDLIGDEQNVVSIARLAEQLKIDRMVHAHARRTLHQRLYHDGGR